jgi:hypothetical protein
MQKSIDKRVTRRLASLRSRGALFLSVIEQGSARLPVPLTAWCSGMELARRILFM